jgi:hypothetical protein
LKIKKKRKTFKMLRIVLLFALVANSLACSGTWRTVNAGDTCWTICNGNNDAISRARGFGVNCENLRAGTSICVPWECANNGAWNGNTGAWNGNTGAWNGNTGAWNGNTGAWNGGCSGATRTVNAGDTCWSICNGDGNLANQIRNFGTNCDNLRAGDSICVPWQCGGNTGAWNGNTGAWNGNTGAWNGNTGAWNGNTGAWDGNTGAWNGNTGAWNGNTGAWNGNTGAWNECASGRAYDVVSGDTCEKIARWCGLNTADFISRNGARGVNWDCTNLRIGQRLCC